MTTSPYAAHLREPGPWCTYYASAVDATAEAQHVRDVTARDVADQLRADGAPDPDVKAIAGALTGATHIEGPSCRFLVAREGELVFNHVFAGEPLTHPRTVFGPLPDLVPLIRHLPADFAYVLVEASRDGGEIALWRASGSMPINSIETGGGTENLSKSPRGGWSQGHYQHRTEEIWRRNTAEIAHTVTEAVRRSGAVLVFASGDERAVNLFADQLDTATRDILVLLPSNTRAEGSASQELRTHIDTALSEHLARRQHEDLDRLATESGRPDGASEHGFGAIVSALQQSQVEVLFIDEETLAGRRTLVLDAEPWIATDPNETFGATVLGEAEAPAGLLRAALLTDATVHFLPSEALPGGVETAAITRWPTGPRSEQ